MSAPTNFETACQLIDDANRQDPNIETFDGKDWPKELLYSTRMVDMLSRFYPQADEAQQLAIRAQHITRWKSPRNAYPEGRIGYLQWRKDLYKYHANTAGELLTQAAYDDETISRAKDAIAKRRIKENPDTQLLEDIADLVFLEYYMQPFVDKHPDYSEEKWIDIILKTWNKMSTQAQAFALSGKVDLPTSLVPLIQKAIATL